MKKYIKFKSVFILSLFALMAVSCLDDDDGGIQRPDQNVVDLARATGDLSLLVDALERANLVSDLETASLITVLAPTDAAFTTFLDNNDYENIDAVPVETLRRVLLYHVLAGEIRSNNLINAYGYAQTLSEGPVDDTRLSLLVDGTDGVRFNDTADVTQNFDIVASNGTIHIVDAVIGLPFLDTFITIDDDFSELETALTTATPSVDFMDILSPGNGPFTLFGPTDTAFDNLLSGNSDWSSVDDIDEDLLEAVLSHHVIGGDNIVLADIADLDGMESPPTLEGDALTFNVINNNSVRITDGSGSNDIDITAFNIQTMNGVIHIIDKVMIPDTDN